MNKHSNNEYSLPELVIQSSEELRAVLHTGNYFNIGSKIGYIKASINYGLKDEDINKELIEYMKELVNKNE